MKPAFTDFIQAGASQYAWFALRGSGDLLTWGDSPAAPPVLMRGVARFAAGQSGWFAIDAAGALCCRAAGAGRAPERVADACIGDSADYYVTRDGALFVVTHQRSGHGRPGALCNQVGTTGLCQGLLLFEGLQSCIEQRTRGVVVTAPLKQGAAQ